MAFNIWGLVAVIVFYIITLVIGVVASRKTVKTSNSNEIFLANRGLGLYVSIFTITATMVGGAFINGTTEVMAFKGLLWTQAPVGYCLALFFSSVFYAPKMRRSEYVTMFDPFQNRYGKRIGGLLFIPQFLGDLFWTAAILSALGNTVSVILDIDRTMSIIVSACVAILYTCLGGLFAVAYTDVIQMFFIAIGLFLAFPFALVHPSVDLNSISDTWLGEIPTSHIWMYIDIFLLLVCGGIPWQTFYQRVLACKTPETARRAGVIASIACLCMALPPVMMGVAGSAADWNKTSYPGEIPFPKDKHSFILPLVLQYMCPFPVAVIGIGVVAAAVMSSADSCILSTGTVFAKNIYKDIFRQQASQREIVWVLRVSIVLVGIAATVVAVVVDSVYGLFTLCSDLMYVVLFPQLTCVLWIGNTNTYGCVFGYLVAVLLRLGGGETLVGLPTLIEYPMYSEQHGQLFPFRTLAMVLSFGSIIGVSILMTWLFKKGFIPLRFDVLGVMSRRSPSDDSPPIQMKKWSPEPTKETS